MYRMSRNEGTETPGSLVFVDTEAKERVIRSSPKRSVLSFRMGCATYVRFEKGLVSRRDEIDFFDWMEFWEWLDGKCTKERPLWVFGHNLGFDLTLMHYWEMSQLGRYRHGSIRPEESNGILSGSRSWKGRLVVDGFPFYVYSMGQRGLLRFVDTLNYYPKALAHIGEQLGYSKLSWPGFDASDETMATYCRRDVEITERLMVDTLRCWVESDAGVFQPTSAMLALTSFRHKLPKTKRPAGDPTIVLDDRDGWQVMERDAYYGGQVTAFYVGRVSPDVLPDGSGANYRRVGDSDPPRGPLYLLDVRSLYPAVMRDRKFPFKRDRPLRNPEPAELLAMMSTYGAIARIRISSDSDEYTLRTDRGQLQAVGDFDTCLCGPELERALRAGHVSRVYEAQTYCMDYLFRDWVDSWLKVRDDADRVGDKLRSDYAKLIMNSLSGKFAQQGKHWKERHDITPPEDYGHWVEVDRDGGTRTNFRAVAGVTQEQVMGDPPWYTFPSISAYVTAIGREHMRWLRAQCPPRSVLYQATDSLLVTQDGYFALEELGLIREGWFGYLQVKKVAADGEVRGCNHYRVGDQWVRSGGFGQAKRRDDGSYFYTAFESTSQVLMGQPDGTVRVDEIDLTDEIKYTKGTVTRSGWVEWPRLGTEEVPF